MKIEYDKEADAIYICLQDKEVAKTVEISDSVNVDLDENEDFIGIEVIDATQRYSLSEIFNLSMENFVFDERMVSPHIGQQL